MVVANISFNVPLGKVFSDITGRSYARNLRSQETPGQQVRALNGLSERVMAHQRSNPGRSITGF